MFGAVCGSHPGNSGPAHAFCGGGPNASAVSAWRCTSMIGACGLRCRRRRALRGARGERQRRGEPCRSSRNERTHVSSPRLLNAGEVYIPPLTDSKVPCRRRSASADVARKCRPRPSQACRNSKVAETLRESGGLAARNHFSRAAQKFPRRFEQSIGGESGIRTPVPNRQCFAAARLRARDFNLCEQSVNNLVPNTG